MSTPKTGITPAADKALAELVTYNKEQASKAKGVPRPLPYDISRTLDEIHRTVGLLEAMRQGHPETTGLYKAFPLAEALELQAEIFLACVELEECCGHNATICGHCKEIDQQVQSKRHQVEQRMEVAAA